MPPHRMPHKYRPPHFSTGLTIPIARSETGHAVQFNEVYPHGAAPPTPPRPCIVARADQTLFVRRTTALRSKEWPSIWLGLVGAITGAIGAITGVAGAVLGYLGYKKSKQLALRDLRLELRKAVSDLRLNIGELPALLDHAKGSRMACPQQPACFDLARWTCGGPDGRRMLPRRRLSKSRSRR